MSIPINPVLKTSGGSRWGILGKIGGGLLTAVGAAAAPFTGGASLAATLPAAAGTALGVGGTIADAKNPQKQTQSSALQGAAGQTLEGKMARVAEARKELSLNTNIPEPQRLELDGHFASALDILKRRMG